MYAASPLPALGLPVSPDSPGGLPPWLQICVAAPACPSTPTCLHIEHTVPEQAGVGIHRGGHGGRVSRHDRAAQLLHRLLQRRLLIPNGLRRAGRRQGGRVGAALTKAQNAWQQGGACAVHSAPLQRQGGTACWAKVVRSHPGRPSRGRPHPATPGTAPIGSFQTPIGSPTSQAPGPAQGRQQPAGTRAWRVPCTPMPACTSLRPTCSSGVRPPPKIISATSSRLTCTLSVQRAQQPKRGALSRRATSRRQQRQQGDTPAVGVARRCCRPPSPSDGPACHAATPPAAPQQRHRGSNARQPPAPVLSAEGSAHVTTCLQAALSRPTPRPECLVVLLLAQLRLHNVSDGLRVELGMCRPADALRASGITAGSRNLG